MPIVITRIVFDADFAQAIRIRGLTLTEVAKRAEVTVATASAAAHGRPVNIRTAVQLSRAVAAAPVIPELEVWVRAPSATAKREPGDLSPHRIVPMTARHVSPRRRPLRERPIATETQTLLELHRPFRNRSLVSTMGSDEDGR